MPSAAAPRPVPGRQSMLGDRAGAVFVHDRYVAPARVRAGDAGSGGGPPLWSAYATPHGNLATWRALRAGDGAPGPSEGRGATHPRDAAPVRAGTGIRPPIGRIGQAIPVVGTMRVNSCQPSCHSARYSVGFRAHWGPGDLQVPGRGPRVMLDDDPFDLDSAEGVVLVAGSGVLDDDAGCDCVCGCDRTATWPDDLCLRCQAGDHESTDPTGPADARAARPIFTADPAHLADPADPAHLTDPPPRPGVSRVSACS